MEIGVLDSLDLRYRLTFRVYVDDGSGGLGAETPDSLPGVRTDNAAVSARENSRDVASSGHTQGLRASPRVERLSADAVADHVQLASDLSDVLDDWVH